MLPYYAHRVRIKYVNLNSSETLHYFEKVIYFSVFYVWCFGLWKALRDFSTKSVILKETQKPFVKRWSGFRLLHRIIKQTFTPVSLEFILFYSSKDQSPERLSELPRAICLSGLQWAQTNHIYAEWDLMFLYGEIKIWVIIPYLDKWDIS